MDQAAAIVEAGGIEAWSRVTVEEILGAEDAPHYTKSTDILEVWFDSGSTFFHVLRGTHPEVHHDSGPEADLYLEGHDQHRGWFHSSLLLASALYGRAPYKGLLTHGFTVDSQGRKMSKSLGNGIDPQEINKKLGAEIIRLWVAASDYSGDIAGDDKILARVVDAYRRIRNTLRFLLANVSDFDPATDAVPFPQMLEIDRYALTRAAEFQAEVLAHYQVYEFHPVVAKLQLYCSEDLGGFYLDVLKDRLYTTAPKSLARRSAQTALHQITHAMLRWMAPFLSFTAEEAWKTFGHSDSIFLETYQPIAGADEGLAAKWTRIRAIRDAVNKEIEAVRAAGQVGSSLQANVTLVAAPEDHALLSSLGEDLKFVFITSAVEPGGGRCARHPRGGQPGRQVRALLALPRRRGPGPGPPDHLRPVREQPARQRRNAGARINGPRQRFFLRFRQGLAVALAGLGRAAAGGRPVHQDADPGLLPPGRRHLRHQLLQHRAGAQHRRGVLVPGERGRLAALGVHRHRRGGGALHRLAAARPSGAEAVLLRALQHPGRRHRQRGGPHDARLRGGLPGLPRTRLALPGLQPGRLRDHGRRGLPDHRRA